MKHLNLFFKKIKLIIILAFINLININCLFDVSLLKIHYFEQAKNLYYVNAFNNLDGDLYLEFWGEDTKTRYFIGLNATDENDLYIRGNKIFSIDSSYTSIHHDSAIIYDSNNKENIFSINYIYFDYINIEGNEITSVKTDDKIFENKGADPSFRNSITKLKYNNYYLLSICTIKEGILSTKTHHISFIVFKFNSNNIDGYSGVTYKQKTISRINSTDCFQTESEYIQCSYTNVLPSNLFHVGIYDLYDDLNEKKTVQFEYIKDNTFTKIFHIKDEIGAYIFYDDRDRYNDNPIPKIYIKELNSAKNNLVNLFSFEYINLNGNGNYAFKTALFFSDAIKVNDSKIVVIMTTKDSNLLFCILDLYYEKSYVKVKYYLLNLIEINVYISINIRAFTFKNYFGCIFYNSNKEYSGYFLLNYPNNTSINRINYKEIKITLFEDSNTYSFSIEENYRLINNLYGGEEKIKIISFPNKSSSGIILSSNDLNREISINDELDKNDKILFKPGIIGAIPGEYILSFSLIVTYSNEDSIADKIEYRGNNSMINEILYQSITDESFKIIYKVECHNYTYIDENGIFYCMDNCYDEHFKYIKNENDKYCLSSCSFNREQLYSDSDNKFCFESCSKNIFNKSYVYQTECVEECPSNYNPDSNNICILIEDKIDEISAENSENNPSTFIGNGEDSETESTIKEFETTIIYNTHSTPSTESERIFNEVETTIIYNTHSTPSTESESIFNEVENNSLNIINSETLYLSYENNIFNNESSIFNNGSSSGIKAILYNYISKNSPLEVEKDQNNSLIYSCYSSRTDLDILMNLYSNLTYLNLKECEQLLIEENNLDDNVDLLILGIESTKILDNSSVNNYNYEIYTRKGERISNLSICDNTKVEISSPIINLDLINYEKALFLNNQGYDIYNLSSDFYFDVCTSAYINNSDLTLSVRYDDIFPDNVSFCQSGCEYNRADLENKRFVCLCNSNLSKNIDLMDSEEIVEEVEENFFIYIIDMINYQIIKCYKLLNDINNYFYNFGFYVGVSINFMIIILLFVYYFQGKKSIKLQYLQNEPNKIKIKKNLINQDYKNNKNKLKYNFEGIKDCQRIERRKGTKRKAKTHVVKKRKITSFQFNSNPTKKNNSFKRLTKKFGTKKKNTMIIRNNFEIKIDIHRDNKNSNSNMFVNSNENMIGEKNLSGNDFIQSFDSNKVKNNPINYNELTYGQAVKKDERNLIQIFISLFNIKLEIIQILFFPKEFSHKSLTLSLYLFDLLLDLTINSLLFSDDVISQKYYDNGELKLLTSNILSITSNIISNFLLFLTEKLIDYYDILIDISKEIKNNNEFYKIFIKISCLIQFKIILFFIFVFIIGIFCTYYLFIFCAIYKKIQKNLFINYIIGSVWSLAFTVGICLIITIIRKIALSKKIKRLYLISRFIDEKF